MRPAVEEKSAMWPCNERKSFCIPAPTEVKCVCVRAIQSSPMKPFSQLFKDLWTQDAY